MIVVSKCLAGVRCRYDGCSNLVPAIKDLVDAGEAIPVCPEVLGGLPTPRAPSEIQPDGNVKNKLGEDVTDAFVGGAEAAFSISVASGCTGAILKARSPSCGAGTVYDGSFSSKTIDGNGLFAQLLWEADIPVLTEEEYLAQHRSKS